MVISEEDLKKLILEKGLITEKALADIEKYAKETEISLDEALIEKNSIPEEGLGLLVAQHLGVPFISLSRVSIPEDIFRIIPEKFARRHKVIAFAKDPNGIKVAMSNPTNTTLLEMIARKTNQKILPHYAIEHDVHNTFKLYRKDLQKIFEDMVQRDETGTVTAVALDEAPIATIVDALIDYAYQNQTSDIHIEPQEQSSIVRCRIDGVLHDVLLLPKSFHERILTRIKVASRLRTDEHLSAQDGKMRVQLEEEHLDIRISIIPIVDGEKVVMRLLSSKSRRFSLVDLGMNESDLNKVQAAFSRSFGMILSTGPTGSGKSTSIYAILKILNTREKNITTIEDPVEYRIKGVNQIQVITKTNLTFAAGLRSILRQDPNIIFVGEIRDTETAGIAVNAALTGHLVLSTLHTNDAATTLPRLTDMKIEPFLVASTVNVIIAQRLIRKICENCRTSITVTEEDLLKNFPAEIINRHYVSIGEKKEIRMYKGTGCKICHNTGYSGRVGLFEVLEITKKMRKLIVEKADSDMIAKAAQEEGMSTMLDDGLEKVAKGVTSLEEVLRVTKVESL